MRRFRSLWLVQLSLILLVGSTFLITGYDAGLPLYESKDERRHLDEIYRLRGIEDEPLWMPGYPPGILYVNYGAQLLAELQTGDSAWDQACTIIREIRIGGILTNLLSAVLTALIARKLAGNWAGLLAALAWLVAPRVLSQNQFGFPQIYETFFYLAALYTAILTVEKRQPRWAVLSIITGLGAVAFKYTTLPVLGLGIGAALWLWQTDSRRRWTPVLVIQLGLIVLTGLALIILADPGSLAASGHVESNQFLDNGLQNLLNPDFLLLGLTNGTSIVGIPFAVFVFLTLAGSWFYWRQAATWQRLAWVGTLGLALSHLILLASYVANIEGVDRNVLSTSSLICIIVVVSGVSIARWLANALERPAITTGVALLAAAVWLIPQLVGGWNWIHYRSLPVTYAALRQWTDQYLPEETLLVNDWRPFTREWSCELRTERYAIQDADIMERDLAAWLEDDIYYAQFTRERLDQLRSTPAGQALLDQMTLLKEFPEPGAESQWRTWRRGFEPYLALYRLWRLEPENPTDSVFGEAIRLHGYDLQPADIAPGATLQLRFYWQSLQLPTRDYSLFIHFTPADSPSDVLAQADGVPSRSNFRPTSTWTDPNETFISQTFSLTLPDSLEPGDYILRFGLYDWQTGERLPITDDQDSVEIHVNF